MTKELFNNVSHPGLILGLTFNILENYFNIRIIKIVYI
jgi:hypothetical protein